MVEKRQAQTPHTARRLNTQQCTCVGEQTDHPVEQAGGTLVAFNDASLFAIAQFGLPVTNVVGDLKEDQFYCSGSLLQVELNDVNHPAVWGLPRDPIVMFELGPAFETKEGFRGNVLASYPKERNPLASGYLLHPERIQGKAAALEVHYGDGDPGARNRV